MSSDYCNGVSVKLKYPMSYYYIFNPVLFVISVEHRHFGSRENMPVSHQNLQTSTDIGADSSIHFGPSV